MELWAENRGWKLVEFKSVFWGTGPFADGPSGRRFRNRGEVYYQFVVVIGDGRSASGWVRYDATLFGSWEPEIRWVENTILSSWQRPGSLR